MDWRRDEIFFLYIAYCIGRFLERLVFLFVLILIFEIWNTFLSFSSREERERGREKGMSNEQRTMGVYMYVHMYLISYSI